MESSHHCVLFHVDPKQKNGKSPSAPLRMDISTHMANLRNFRTSIRRILSSVHFLLDFSLRCQPSKGIARRNRCSDRCKDRYRIGTHNSVRESRFRIVNKISTSIHCHSRCHTEPSDHWGKHCCNCHAPPILQNISLLNLGYNRTNTHTKTSKVRHQGPLVLFSCTSYPLIH